jgi:hypothetical protein
MMRNLLACVAVYVGVISAGAVEHLYRFGPLGQRLTADDVKAITRAVTSGNDAPWAVFAWYSQVLPETWNVDAFVAPTGSTAGLRRGTVRHLECKPTEKGGCIQWRVLPERGAYVQVADGPAFSDSVMVRRLSERPIQVDGEFMDRDLISLVLYIRSKPETKSAGGSPIVVSGTYPIMSIERQRNGSVWVRMSEDGGVGETATVRKTDRGWQVTELTFWVA